MMLTIVLQIQVNDYMYCEYVLVRIVLKSTATRCQTIVAAMIRILSNPFKTSNVSSSRARMLLLNYITHIIVTMEHL